MDRDLMLTHYAAGIDAIRERVKIMPEVDEVL